MFLGKIIDFWLPKSQAAQAGFYFDFNKIVTQIYFLLILSFSI